MAGRYKLFLRLMESWPVDSTKKGRDISGLAPGKIPDINLRRESLKSFNKLSRYIFRDLGHHIRKKVLEAFPMGETSNVNAEECEKVYLSLKKICDNYHGNKYMRLSTSSSTGLTYEQCAGISSTDFLTEFGGSRRRLFDWFKKS